MPSPPQRRKKKKEKRHKLKSTTSSNGGTGAPALCYAHASVLTATSRSTSPLIHQIDELNLSLSPREKQPRHGVARADPDDESVVIDIETIDTEESQEESGCSTIEIEIEIVDDDDEGNDDDGPALELAYELSVGERRKRGPVSLATTPRPCSIQSKVGEETDGEHFWEVVSGETFSLSHGHGKRRNKRKQPRILGIEVEREMHSMGVQLKTPSKTVYTEPLSTPNTSALQPYSSLENDDSAILLSIPSSPIQHVPLGSHSERRDLDALASHPAPPTLPASIHKKKCPHLKRQVQLKKLNSAPRLFFSRELYSSSFTSTPSASSSTSSSPCPQYMNNFTHCQASSPTPCGTFSSPSSSPSATPPVPHQGSQPPSSQIQFSPLWLCLNCNQLLCDVHRDMHLHTSFLGHAMDASALFKHTPASKSTATSSAASFLASHSLTHSSTSFWMVLCRLCGPHPLCPLKNKLISIIYHTCAKLQSPATSSLSVEPSSAVGTTTSTRSVASKLTSQSKPSSLRCGLRNLGNTCYANSLFQLLSHTSYLPLPYHAEESEIYGLWRKFLLEMRSGKSILSPRGFLHALEETLQQFDIFEQNDVHEFMLLLFNVLSNEEKKQGRGGMETEEQDKNTCEATEPVSSTDHHDAIEHHSELEQEQDVYAPKGREREEESRQDPCSSSVDQSEIEKYFSSALWNRVVCTKCLHTEQVKETFLSFSLSPLDSILASWSQFLSVESVQKKCDHCHVSCLHSKGYSIHHLSPLLCFHFNRYHRTLSTFPLLHATLSFDSNQHYKLIGLIEHQGRMQSGHYRAYIKHHPPRSSSAHVYAQDKSRDKERDKARDEDAQVYEKHFPSLWYCMDDHTISEVHEHQVLAKRAVLVFYELIPPHLVSSYT